MSEFKGIKQLQALMRAYKPPKPLSQRSQRDFPGNSLQHRAARGLISQAQKIQRSGDKLLGIETTSRSGQKKEVLGFYNMPDPNSPMNKLIRKMGKVQKTKPNISPNVP